jgi:hypothetical protein
LWVVVVGWLGVIRLLVENKRFLVNCGYLEFIYFKKKYQTIYI